MELKAFTLSFDGKANVLTTIIHYSMPSTDLSPNPAVKQDFAIWDTGATASVISNALVTDLGLKPIGMQQIKHAQGTCNAYVYLINIYLPNHILVPNVRVTAGEVNLIGMDIIGLGDFALSNRDGKTLFSFQIPPTHYFDFVKQINHHSQENKKKKKKKK